MFSRVMFSGLALAAVCHAQGGPPVFSQSASSPLAQGGAISTDMIIADMNADGRADILQCYAAYGIGIFYGAGGGGFGSPPTVVLASDAVFLDILYSLAAVDVDNDGNRDLLGMDANAEVGRWLAGTTGFGSFAHFAGGTWGGSEIVLGDVDADGDADLVSGEKLHLNNGSGSFGSGTTLPTTMNVIETPILTDVDGDADLDVLAQEVGFEVYLNNGSGSFSYGSAPGATNNYSSIAAGDMDLDGDPDVVLGLQEQYEPVFNTGSGNFQTLGVSNLPSGLFSTAPGVIFPQLQLADVNGDLYADLIGPAADYVSGVPDVSTGTIVVAVGDGAGSFTNFTRFDGSVLASSSLSIEVWASAVGDVDGDLDTDLVYAEDNPVAQTVRIFRNDAPWVNLQNSLAGTYGPPVLTGTGSFAAGQPFTLSLTNAAHSVGGSVFVATAPIFFPWKGGVIVPDIFFNGSVLGMATDANGNLTINSTGPSALQPGNNIHIYVQMWMPDAAGPVGYSASNALMHQIP